MTRLHLVIVAILLALFMGLGWFFGQKTNPDKMEKTSPSQPISNGVVQDDSGKKVLYWEDPMVEGRHFNKSGKSPFMDMQLAPRYAE